MSRETDAMRDLANAMDQYDVVREYVVQYKDDIAAFKWPAGHTGGNVEVTWECACACDGYKETRSLISELVEDRIGVLLGDAARVAADKIVDAQADLDVDLAAKYGGGEEAGSDAGA